MKQFERNYWRGAGWREFLSLEVSLHGQSSLHDLVEAISERLPEVDLLTLGAGAAAAAAVGSAAGLEEQLDYK